MNKKDLQYFKEKLQKEKALLVEELRSVGKMDPENPGNWDATSGKMQIDTADENEVADKFEEIEDNQMILNKLEPQLHEVEDAMARIEKGTYGICEVSGEEIERDRLEANPSARTSVKHMR
ncbi:MAG TPA: TraR/DksA C4-type zinc finger protein [Candidatus Paceibacterota bacterium]